MDLDTRLPVDHRGPPQPPMALCVGCRQPFWSAEGIARHGDYCASLPPDPMALLERFFQRGAR